MASSKEIITLLNDEITSLEGKVARLEQNFKGMRASREHHQMKAVSRGEVIKKLATCVNDLVETTTIRMGD